MFYNKTIFIILSQASLHVAEFHNNYLRLLSIWNSWSESGTASGLSHINSVLLGLHIRSVNEDLVSFISLCCSFEIFYSAVIEYTFISLVEITVISSVIIKYMPVILYFIKICHCYAQVPMLNRIFIAVFNLDKSEKPIIYLSSYNNW